MSSGTKDVDMTASFMYLNYLPSMTVVPTRKSKEVHGNGILIASNHSSRRMRSVVEKVWI